MACLGGRHNARFSAGESAVANLRSENVQIDADRMRGRTCRPGSHIRRAIPRYGGRMATRKITITLPEELIEAARGLTENLSGYAAEALAAKVRHELLGQELDRYEREHGPIDPRAVAEAEAELFGRVGSVS